MAKKQDLTNVFAKTETGAPPVDNSDLDAGNIRATGVGLREGEIAALDELAYELTEITAGKVSRNALIRHGVRVLITGVRDGSISIVDLAQNFEVPEIARARYKPKD